MFQDVITKLIISLPSLISAFLIFITFYLIARSTTSVIQRLARRSTAQKQPVLALVATLVKVIILLIGAITALGSIGLNVSALVTSLGLSGFAISFATKDAVANLLSGILVLLYQPFKIGDHIQVESFQGKVIKMTLRYTHLRHEEKEILVPNAFFLSDKVIILN